MPEAFGFTDVTTPCLTFGVTENAFCEDRDGHLFWDVLHINRKAHAMIAAIVIEQLPVPDYIGLSLPVWHWHLGAARFESIKLGSQPLAARAAASHGGATPGVR